MSRKIFRTYILRLLAGKFGPICTEFPLSSFSAKILTRLPLKFPAKKIINSISCKKKIEVNANFSTCKKQINTVQKISFLSKEILTQRCLPLPFWSTILCTRWCMEVVNEKASWQAIESPVRTGYSNQIYMPVHTNQFFFKPKACHKTFSEKISISKADECNTGHRLEKDEIHLSKILN